MANNEDDKIEKLLSGILEELQIQNKLMAIQLTQQIVNDIPVLSLDKDKYMILLKGIEETLNGSGLKEMTVDEF